MQLWRSRESIMYVPSFLHGRRAKGQWPHVTTWPYEAIL